MRARLRVEYAPKGDDGQPFLLNLAVICCDVIFNCCLLYLPLTYVSSHASHLDAMASNLDVMASNLLFLFLPGLLVFVFRSASGQPLINTLRNISSACS